MAIQVVERADPRERGQTVVYYRRSQLTIEPGFNIRDVSDPENVAHVAWLAGEIKEKGFTSIIKVMKAGPKTIVTRGHCRTAAIDLLIKRGEWNEAEQKIPTLSEAKGTSPFDLLAIQHSGDDTKPITIAEAVANVKRMMTFGKSEADVAKAIGRSATYVRDMLTLAGAPQSVQAAVEAGEISKTEATKIIREKGPLLSGEAVDTMIKTARAKGKTKATAADEPTQRKPASKSPRASADEVLFSHLVKWTETKIDLPHKTLRSWLEEAGRI